MPGTAVPNKYCPFSEKNCVTECQLYQVGSCAIANSTIQLSALKKSVSDMQKDINIIKIRMK